MTHREMCRALEQAIRSLCMDQDREVSAADVRDAISAVFIAGSNLIVQLVDEELARKRRGQ